MIGGRWIKIVAVAALFIGMALDVQADDAAVKKALMTQYDRMVVAFKAKDLKGLMAPTTSDLTVKLPKGKVMTRTQLEKEFKQQFAETQSVKEWKIEISKLEVRDDKVIASLTSHLIVMVNMQGRTHTLESTQTGKDTWVKTASGWRLKLEEVLKSTTFMDGRSIQ